MIAFGASMTSPELFAQWAGPGITRTAAPDSAVFPYQAAGSLFRSYNLICDHAAAHQDLEALVLVHQDLELDDPDLCEKIRAVLADPDVAVIGATGIVNARSIAWWEGDIVWGSTVWAYGQSGGGRFPATAWNGDRTPPYERPGEVEMVEGSLLVLSPWAVRNLRFDESLGLLHGYDFDYCMQARAAGRKVVAADLRVLHHHSLDLVTENEAWVDAHGRVAEKWEGALPGTVAETPDWRQRARRAEAEAAANRLHVASAQYTAEAMMLDGQAQLGEVVHSRSWRLTEPLRRLNARARERRAPAAA